MSLYKLLLHPGDNAIFIVKGTILKKVLLGQANRYAESDYDTVLAVMSERRITEWIPSPSIEYIFDGVWLRAA